MADRGYVLLWRQLWDSRLFKSAEAFSEREAWIYLFSNLAQGIDKNGLARGEFEAGRNYLARKWNWSEAKVRRFLAKLEQENMIRKAASKPASKSARFIICKYETYQNPRPVKRPANRPQLKEGLNESKKKETLMPEKAGLECPSDFARFWIAYPRKVGKGAAEKAWARIHPAADLLDLILASVELHKQSPDWIKDGGQYIPHPATYLNQRRWEDEVRQEESLHDQLFGKH